MVLNRAKHRNYVGFLCILVLSHHIVKFNETTSYLQHFHFLIDGKLKEYIHKTATYKWQIQKFEKKPRGSGLVGWLNASYLRNIALIYIKKYQLIIKKWWVPTASVAFMDPSLHIHPIQCNSEKQLLVHVLQLNTKHFYRVGSLSK